MIIDTKKPIILWDRKKVLSLEGEKWEMVEKGNKLG